MRGLRLAAVIVLTSAALSTGIRSTEAGLINGDFETGTFGGWTTMGGASIETSAFKSGPTSGSYQASVSTFPSDVENRNTIESFLGLPSGTIQGLVPSGPGVPGELVLHGSAFKQTFSVNAGDVLTFDWNFLTNTPFSPPFSGFNDFAVVTVDTNTSILADALSPSSSSATVHLRETGFETSSFTIPTAGNVTLGFAVFEVGGVAHQSRLLVDDVRVTASTVPEPSSFVLLGVGAFGLLGLRRGRRRQLRAGAR